MSPVASRIFAWKFTDAEVGVEIFQFSHEIRVYSSPLLGALSGSACSQRTSEITPAPFALPTRLSQNGATIGFTPVVDGVVRLLGVLVAVESLVMKPLELT